MGNDQKEYKYGFIDKDVSIFKTDVGINEAIVKEISTIKKEPKWMEEFRLNALKKFLASPLPKFGPNLEFLRFDEYRYYIRPSDRQVKKWEDVPETIKDTFDKLGIIEAEQKFLSGVSTQYESEVVYHNMLKEVEDKGVIFVDTDTALRDYPELFTKYFNKVVKYNDNKFSALNGAVWSGGSFIYVPKGVKLDKPLQSYFRINSQNMGQFERTLIVIDEGADLHYVEGCTAPTYSSESLHAAVVEIYIHKNAKCRYTTIQNWSNNIVNLVTKRAYVEESGVMEWIDGNIGSQVNMKYPACVLAGKNAKGICVSIAVGSNNQIQDAGAKMIHLAPNTSSQIISKSISRTGGRVNYRGLVHISKEAVNSRSHIECDTLILDNKSFTDTIPTNRVLNNKTIIEHEAKVSKVSEAQLFYLMSRGLSLSQATEIIVLGFIEPFTKELPMEYAVELNQLLKMNMNGSIG